MRPILLIACLLPFLAQSQDKEMLGHQADSCYNVKSYALAASYGEAFYKIDSSSDGMTYNIACYCALAGYAQKAIFYLRKSFILGYGAKYLDQDADLTSLHKEAEWPSLVKMTADNYRRFEELNAKRNDERVAAYTAWQNSINNYIQNLHIDTTIADSALYKQLTAYNDYPLLSSFNGNLFLHIALNDSIMVPYLVTLPQNYDPLKPSALLVVLHGAVYTVKEWPKFADENITRYGQKYFTKYAKENNMIIVYPFATEKYNWIYPDDGFGMVTGIIKTLKHFININDDRVYITGHSNGGAGSFNYLIKTPSMFAAFTGMNAQPRVGTGGTFLQNALNRSFYDIATDKDYYFPPWGNDTLSNLMHSLGIDWTVDMHKGYPHWFPEFEAADEPVKNMFTAMLAKKRNPFHASLYWECDDTTYGKCDWLDITSLDTLQKPAPWQKQYNFNIHPWINNQNPDSIMDITKPAFKFPRKSGAVKAAFANNTFTIQASCIKSIRLFISPDMADMEKPIKVIINNKQVYSQKVGYNKAFMFENFVAEFDRKAVWVNYVDVNVP